MAAGPARAAPVGARAPAEPEGVGWWGLVFTPFIAFLFLDPWQRRASRLEWAVTIAGVAVFFALYSVALAFPFRRRVALSMLAGVALLGFLFAPFNQGAALYIIYAASFVPYLVEGDVRLVAAIIGAILAVVLAETRLLHLGWVFGVYSVGYSVILGIGNTWAARKTMAVERLAKMAERERIARDLHDVLGHAFSVITLKSELARRLVDADPERAKSEIADVEKISREALAEVRHTVRGYRPERLQVELDRARSTLETAGVVVECHAAGVDIPADQEGVLALVLREAVTNVVRHAQARTCRLRLEKVDGACRLEIQDDGRGGADAEGYGMRGMRERIEAFGGTLRLDAHAGTRLTITLPPAESPAGRA